MMIEGLLTAAFGGGATGIVGSIIGKVGNWLEEKQKIEAKTLEYKHELKLLELQGHMSAKEQENELALIGIGASRDVINASYTHDTNFGQASQWVINILRLVRPTLTVILIILTGLIAWKMASIETEQQSWNSLIEQVTFLTTMAVSWWFGDRARR